jgi:hypothetical protein
MVRSGETKFLGSLSWIQFRFEPFKINFPGNFVVGMPLSEAIILLQNSKNSLQVDIVFDTQV